MIASFHDLLTLDPYGALPRHQRSSSVDDLPALLEEPPDPPSSKAMTWLIPTAIGPYRLSDTIGQGSFSIVKLAHRGDATFACKILERAGLAGHGSEVRFESEIRVLQQLHHPGIVTLIDLLKDRHFSYVLLEYCPSGDLFSRIVSSSKLSAREAQPLFRQIAEAVAYIHRIGVCHRDIKPENVLLDDRGRAKLSDFGMGRFCQADGLVRTPCGSPCYSSPECLADRPYDGRANDCWSLGVTLFAMMTGDLPWTKRNKVELYEQIRTGSYSVPLELPLECRELIRRLLCVDPKARLTAEGVLQSAWVQAAPAVASEAIDAEECQVSLRRVDGFFEREPSAVKLTFDRVRSHGAEKFEAVERVLRKSARIGRK
jgi:serine/threonine protein kinase